MDSHETGLPPGSGINDDVMKTKEKKDADSFRNQ